MHNEELRLSPRYWSAKDIDLLKSELQKGSKLKQIAYLLKRSESAVGKFAARHGLSKFHRKQKHSSEISEYSTKVKRKLQYNISKITYNTTSCFYGEFVNFETVIKYLQSKSYIISCEVPKIFKTFYPNSSYLLNGQPVSKIKLLLLANNLRLEDKKDVFKIYDTIW